MNNENKEILNDFGKKVIDSVRDQTINQAFRTIQGQIQDNSSKAIAERLANLSNIQEEAIRDLVIDTIDGALNNFLWLLEQEEQIDLISYQDSRPVSLKKVSDGLSVDYWNFVDDFSKYKRVD